MAFICRSIINTVCVTALLFALKAIAADDEYLKMLEAEAKGLEVDKSGQLDQSRETDEVSPESIMNLSLKSSGVQEGGALQPGLKQEEFVEVLKRNFYGSFVFYLKLDSIDQQTVYYNYTKSSPAYIDSIRQDILDHLKDR